ncbi:MAG TPA: VOC family protein [Vicinamibacterales bacterium]
MTATRTNGEPAGTYGIRPPGFRLPDATQVGMVRLQVSDLRRSIEYYERILGFRIHDSTGHAATLGPLGADSKPLLTLETRGGLKPARRGALGLYHFAILLPDRAALGSFAAHLSERRVRVGMADHFVSEAFYLWDPDGLGIEVYADRPRDAWRAKDRELLMTTDPLDVGALVTASEGRPWNGMPAGTTIGHVHLHVGDLEAADAFYHSALGLDRMVWSYPGALFLAAGGYHHHLGTNIWSSEPPARDDEARLIEWELLVPSAGDADAARRSLRDAGYDAQATDGIVTVADPWGTRLSIRPR